MCIAEETHNRRTIKRTLTSVKKARQLNSTASSCKYSNKHINNGQHNLTTVACASSSSGQSVTSIYQSIYTDTDSYLVTNQQPDV